MSWLSLIIKLIGWPAFLLLCFYVYEEGIPGAARIPFLSSVPIVGDLTTGRVHAYAADQVKIATAQQTAICNGKLEKLVSGAELAAANAKAAELERQRNAYSQSYEELRKRMAAADQSKDQKDAKLQKSIADDTGNDGAVWTDGDIKWLRSH